MPVSYSPWLVLLSVALAIQGSYVGLTSQFRLPAPRGRGSARSFAGAAITLALGVWTNAFRWYAGGARPFRSTTSSCRPCCRSLSA